MTPSHTTLIPANFLQSAFGYFFFYARLKIKNNGNRASPQPLKYLLFLWSLICRQILISADNHSLWNEKKLIHIYDPNFFFHWIEVSVFLFFFFSAVITPSSEIFVECQLSRLFKIYHFLPWIVSFIEFVWESLAQSVDEGQGSLGIQ